MSWISGARLFWPSTAASIPSGWTRDTNFDGRMLAGTASGDNPGTNRGATTHTHTTDAHSHTFFAHSHTLQVSGGASIGAFTADAIGFQNIVSDGHTHLDSSTATAVITTQTTVVITDSEAQLPLSLTMIVIQNDSATQCPNGSLLFTDDLGQTLTNYSAYSSLDGKYIVGASTGADGGSSVGASSHSHTSTNHTHTANTHTHADSNFGDSGTVGTATENAKGTLGHNSGIHHQATSIGSTVVTIGNFNPIFDATSNELSYMKLAALSPSIDTNFPESYIVPYVNTASNLTSEFKVCDGTNGTPDLRSRYVKGCLLQKDIGEFGGSNTHLHSSPPHQHGQNNHGHTFTETRIAIQGFNTARAGFSAATSAHTHGKGFGFTLVDYNAGLILDGDGETAITMSASDGRYSYREVLWIKKIKPITVHLKGKTTILGKAHIK